MKAIRVKKSRYASIAKELMRSIRSGKYKVGDLMPSEADLCERYNISHYTARSAIRMLQDLRLVVTEHGRGSRIISNDVRGRYVHILDSIPEFGDKVKDTTIEVLQRSRVKAEQTDEVDLPPHTEWHRIEALRYTRKAEPLVWKAIYIAGEFSKAAAAIGKSNAPIYTLIERMHNETPVRVHQEVSAMVIDGRIARALRVKAGVAGLVIDRRYFGSHGKELEITRSVYPADKFRYSSDLHLEPPRQT